MKCYSVESDTRSTAGSVNGAIRQIESITFGWCDYNHALEFIFDTINGEDDNNGFARPVNATMQTPEEHVAVAIVSDWSE